MFILLKQKHHNKGRTRMFILHDILEKLKKEFANSRKGEERGIWFIYTLVAIIIPLHKKIWPVVSYDIPTALEQ